jgi:hypothetical protein
MESSESAGTGGRAKAVSRFACHRSPRRVRIGLGHVHNARFQIVEAQSMRQVESVLIGVHPWFNFFGVNPVQFKRSNTCLARAGMISFSFEWPVVKMTRIIFPPAGSST